MTGSAAGSTLVEQLTAGDNRTLQIDPLTLVIFGGAGDLAHRKLLPALYNLQIDGLLPPRIAIVGTGRKEMSDDDYRAFAKDGVTQFSRRPIDEALWQTFASSLFFVNASLDNDRGVRVAGRAARFDRARARAAGQSGLLPCHSADAVCANRQAAASLAFCRAPAIFRRSSILHG